MDCVMKERTVQWARAGLGRWQGGFVGKVTLAEALSRMRWNHLCKDLKYPERTFEAEGSKAEKSSDAPEEEKCE